MKLHRNLVFAVIDALQLIFNENQYADKTVEKVLKRDKRWGARDRGFIAETVYELVRWKRLYATIAEVKVPFDRDDLWRMFAVWAVLRGIHLPDWKYFENTPSRKIKGRFDEFIKERKYRESIPDWIDERGLKELGETIWTAELKALNTPAPVVLRTNTLKTNREQLRKELLEASIVANPLSRYPDALELTERTNVFNTSRFKDGWFEVQDASSQRVAPFLQVSPGMRVVDACAGAGGKTLHLAALMQNKGQLIALDIYENKLKELKRRARRNGVHNVEVRKIETQKTIKKLHSSADRVLIDAPCSGLGVLRRNPDAKWKLQPDFLESLIQTQQDILQNYSKMVKPGGKMAYATCSILPSENRQQINTFLASEAGKLFSLEKEDTILAHKSGYDGFYMALLRRSEE
ncbi:RsmB/NOP family class I SAM-dependent RNA methyltransferase [Ascidiimonas aurantiaca]|uniref:RsmB/NOP family class I SAM-dependent RNA methyltransferase n=1 Tax=Ascidiimonas aurantiaca TaxID=1685432 RepID=UPI0030EE4958